MNLENIKMKLIHQILILLVLTLDTLKRIQFLTNIFLLESQNICRDNFHNLNLFRMPYLILYLLFYYYYQYQRVRVFPLYFQNHNYIKLLGILKLKKVERNMCKTNHALPISPRLPISAITHYPNCCCFALTNSFS